MATISKFYFHDAASTVVGTLPSNSPTTQVGGVLGTGTEATGAGTARTANDTIGVANPDTESSITAAANQTQQRLGHRRFVSSPLAAHTFAAVDGNWTFSYASSESNTNHNGQIRCVVYGWTPSTGTPLGQIAPFTGTTMSATAETAFSVTATTASPITISDGDVLIFDVYTLFTQGMSTAYTDQFAYDGTTEANTTACASFVTPPSALTLFTQAPPVVLQPHPAFIYLRKNG